MNQAGLVAAEEQQQAAVAQHVVRLIDARLRGLDIPAADVLRRLMPDAPVVEEPLPLVVIPAAVAGVSGVVSDDVVVVSDSAGMAGVLIAVVVVV